MKPSAAKRAWIPMVALGLLLVGCVDTEQGQCDAPHDNVTWHWVKEKGPYGWTAYKCILCDETLASEDGEVTGCFYSYPSSGWEDPALCEADVCSDNPSINDPVQPNHGAYKHISDGSLVRAVVANEPLPTEDESQGPLHGSDHLNGRLGL